MNNRPLRVLVDARMLLGRFSGVSRYVTRLIDELVRQGGIEVVALCGAGAKNPWIDREDVETIISSFSRADRVASRRVEWDGLYLRQIIKDSGVDLFHATWNTGIPAFSPVPGILTIHDLIPWREPNGHFSTSWQRRCYRYAQRASARRARQIITVSNHVSEHVIEELGVSPAKVVTIYNGVDPIGGDASSPASIAYRYVLYVGGHEPRKNLAGLFDAMQAYWNQHDERLLLHLTGTRESLDDAAERAFSRLTHRNHVVFLGSVDDCELSHQYASAAATITLSLDEGFGLPVLEAMAHGCPVVAADRAALPEVVGPAGILVDPVSQEGIVAGIRRAVTPSEFRSNLVERGLARARRFSWHRTAEIIRATYETAPSAPVISEVTQSVAVSGV